MTGPIQKAVSQTPAKGKKSSMADLVEKMRPAIEAALPSVLTPERFTRICLSALSANAGLQECEPQSFLAAMMTAAQLGVEPNTPLGQAYLIPYRNNNKGVLECQFQLGYKGLIDLAFRSGEIASIQAHTVYQNDTFSYSYGLDPKLEHIPAMGNRGDPICFYAVFKTKGGGFGFEVLSKDEAEQHRKRYSKAKTSPWSTNFEEMAKKTVLKRVLKYAPLKSDFAKAVTADEAVRYDIGRDMLDLPAEYVASDEYEVMEEQPEQQPSEAPTIDLNIDIETGEVLEPPDFLK